MIKAIRKKKTEFDHVLMRYQNIQGSGQDFEIYEGEIVEITGLAGQGQEQFSEGLFGLRKAFYDVWYKGEKLTPGNTAQLIDKKLYYLSEDRANTSLFLESPIWKNIIFGTEGSHPEFYAMEKIEKYGPDTNIFGTNCPMYDVILDEAFKLKFIIAEQCCPTPTQAYPTVLNLEITPEDLGDYTKINDMITEKAKDAGMTGKLSGWAMPSQVYTPQFQVELVKYMHDNNLKPEDVRSVEFLNKFSKEHMAVAADFATAGEGLDNYFLFILEDIYY